jgi:exodeoxyribonuclease VII large subunit
MPSPPQLPFEDPRSRRHVWTVSALNARLRGLVESALGEVWIAGELSGCRVWNTGHLYFTLKDRSSQLKGVVFRSALRYLKFTPEDGQSVIVRGRVSVYEPKGEYQIVAEHIEPQGLGALQLAFEQLKQRLQDEGLFDAARKRPLPTLPRAVGIVTSLDGAAIRDIIQVLGRRHAGLRLIIRPARVQGEGAALAIAHGIKAVARVPEVDVVIVGRGGGSIEDLWAFNEEIVARAIALSPVPVISAVGHETDVTIADFVADLRAPTPSAAAEMVVDAAGEWRARVARHADRLRAALRGRLQDAARRVHRLEARPALAGVPGRVALRGRQVSELHHALARALQEGLAAHERRLFRLDRRLDARSLAPQLAGIRTRLVAADARIHAAAAARHDRARAALRATAGRLEMLSPLAVLSRGYAVCWTADRQAVLRDAADAVPGDRVRVTLARGELECDVRAAGPVPHDARARIE